MASECPNYGFTIGTKNTSHWSDSILMMICFADGINNETQPMLDSLKVNPDSPDLDGDTTRNSMVLMKNLQESSYFEEYENRFIRNTDYYEEFQTYVKFMIYCYSLPEGSDYASRNEPFFEAAHNTANILMLAKHNPSHAIEDLESLPFVPQYDTAEHFFALLAALFPTLEAKVNTIGLKAWYPFTDLGTFDNRLFSMFTNDVAMDALTVHSILKDSMFEKPCFLRTLDMIPVEGFTIKHESNSVSAICKFKPSIQAIFTCIDTGFYDPVFGLMQFDDELFGKYMDEDFLLQLMNSIEHKEERDRGKLVRLIADLEAELETLGVSPSLPSASPTFPPASPSLPTASPSLTPSESRVPVKTATVNPSFFNDEDEDATEEGESNKKLPDLAIVPATATTLHEITHSHEKTWSESDAQIKPALLEDSHKYTLGEITDISTPYSTYTISHSIPKNALELANLTYSLFNRYTCIERNMYSRVGSTYFEQHEEFKRYQLAFFTMKGSTVADVDILTTHSFKEFIRSRDFIKHKNFFAREKFGDYNSIIAHLETNKIFMSFSGNLDHAMPIVIRYNSVDNYTVYMVEGNGNLTNAEPKDNGHMPLVFKWDNKKEEQIRKLLIFIRYVGDMERTPVLVKTKTPYLWGDTTIEEMPKVPGLWELPFFRLMNYESVNDFSKAIRTEEGTDKWITETIRLFQQLYDVLKPLFIKHNIEKHDTFTQSLYHKCVNHILEGNTSLKPDEVHGPIEVGWDFPQSTGSCAYWGVKYICKYLIFSNDFTNSDKHLLAYNTFDTFIDFIKESIIESFYNELNNPNVLPLLILNTQERVLNIGNHLFRNDVLCLLQVILKNNHAFLMENTKRKVIRQNFHNILNQAYSAGPMSSGIKKPYGGMYSTGSTDWRKFMLRCIEYMNTPNVENLLNVIKWTPPNELQTNWGKSNNDNRKEIADSDYSHFHTDAMNSIFEIYKLEFNKQYANSKHRILTMDYNLKDTSIDFLKEFNQILSLINDNALGREISFINLFEILTDFLSGDELPIDPIKTATTRDGISKWITDIRAKWWISSSIIQKSLGTESNSYFKRHKIFKFVYKYRGLMFQSRNWNGIMYWLMYPKSLDSNDPDEITRFTKEILITCIQTSNLKKTDFNQIYNIINSINSGDYENLSTDINLMMTHSNNMMYSCLETLDIITLTQDYKDSYQYYYNILNSEIIKYLNEGELKYTKLYEEIFPTTGLLSEQHITHDKTYNFMSRISLSYQPSTKVIIEEDYQRDRLRFIISNLNIEKFLEAVGHNRLDTNIVDFVLFLIKFFTKYEVSLTDDTFEHYNDSYILELLRWNKSYEGNVSKYLKNTINNYGNNKAIIQETITLLDTDTQYSIRKALIDISLLTIDKNMEIIPNYVLLNSTIDPVISLFDFRVYQKTTEKDKFIISNGIKKFEIHKGRFDFVAYFNDKSYQFKEFQFGPQTLQLITNKLNFGHETDTNEPHIIWNSDSFWRIDLVKYKGYFEVEPDGTAYYVGDDKLKYTVIWHTSPVLGAWVFGVPGAFLLKKNTEFFILLLFNKGLEKNTTYMKTTDNFPTRYTRGELFGSEYLNDCGPSSLHLLKLHYSGLFIQNPDNIAVQQLMFCYITFQNYLGQKLLLNYFLNIVFDAKYKDELVFKIVNTFDSPFLFVLSDKLLSLTGAADNNLKKRKDLFTNIHMDKTNDIHKTNNTIRLPIQSGIHINPVAVEDYDHFKNINTLCDKLYAERVKIDSVSKETRKGVSRFLCNFRHKCTNTAAVKGIYDEWKRNLVHPNNINHNTYDIIFNELCAIDNLLPSTGYLFQKLYNELYKLMIDLKYEDIVKNLLDLTSEEQSDCGAILKEVESFDKRIIFDVMQPRTLDEVFFELLASYFLRCDQIPALNNLYNDLYNTNTPMRTVCYETSGETNASRKPCYDKNKTKKEDTSIVKLTESAYEILMGRGKTSTLTPLLILHDYIFNNNIDNYSIVLPKHLVNQSFKIMRNIAPVFADVIINRHTFTNINNETIPYSDIHIDRWRWNKPTVHILSDTDIKSLISGNIMDKVNHENSGDSGLYNGIIGSGPNLFIFDEVDSVLNALQSDLNRPFTHSKHPNMKEIAIVCHKAIRNLRVDKVYQIANDTKMPLVNIMNPYDDKPLIRVSIGYSDPELPTILQNKINKTLKDIKTMILNQKYGLGKKPANFLLTLKNFKKHKPFFTASPYSANHTPIEGSEFSDFELTAILTAEVYYREGLRIEDIIYIILYIYSQTKYELLLMLTKSEKEQFMQTYKSVMAIYGYDFLVEYLFNQLGKTKNKEYMKLFDDSFLTKLNNERNIAHKYDLISWYLEYIIYPTFFDISIRQINISMVDIYNPSISRKKVSFSGTVNFNAPAQIIKNELFTKDAIVDAKFYDGQIGTIIRDDIVSSSIEAAFYGETHSKKAEIITYFETSEEEAIAKKTVVTEVLPELYVEHNLIQYIVSHLSNYNALIDTAGLILKTKPEDVMSQIYAKLNETIRAELMPKLIFINSKDIKMFYMPNGQSYEYDNKKHKNAFMYYDHKHTVGTDIIQTHRMHALVTVQSKNTLTEIAQGMFRLRNLNVGHSVDFYCPAKMKLKNSDTTLATWNIVGDTLNQLYIHLKFKDKEFMAQSKESTQVQCSKYVLRKQIPKKSSFEENIFYDTKRISATFKTEQQYLLDDLYTPLETATSYKVLDSVKAISPNATKKMKEVTKEEEEEEEEQEEETEKDKKRNIRIDQSMPAIKSTLLATNEYYNDYFLINNTINPNNNIVIGAWTIYLSQFIYQTLTFLPLFIHPNREKLMQSVYYLHNINKPTSLLMIGFEQLMTFKYYLLRDSAVNRDKIVIFDNHGQIIYGSNNVNIPHIVRLLFFNTSYNLVDKYNILSRWLPPMFLLSKPSVSFPYLAIYRQPENERNTYVHMLIEFLEYLFVKEYNFSLTLAYLKYELPAHKTHMSRVPEYKEIGQQCTSLSAEQCVFVNVNNIKDINIERINQLLGYKEKSWVNLEKSMVIPTNATTKKELFLSAFEPNILNKFTMSNYYPSARKTTFNLLPMTDDGILLLFKRDNNLSTYVQQLNDHRTFINFYISKIKDTTLEVKNRANKKEIINVTYNNVRNNLNRALVQIDYQLAQIRTYSDWDKAIRKYRELHVVVSVGAPPEVKKSTSWFGGHNTRKNKDKRVKNRHADIVRQISDNL